LPFTEETLTTKDNVKLKAYVILQETNPERMPTILYFHVRLKRKFYNILQLTQSMLYLGKRRKYGKGER
jgi:hypothetical protein